MQGSEADVAEARIECVNQHLTQDERSVLGLEFGLDPRPQPEVKDVWKRVMADPLFATVWGGSSVRVNGMRVHGCADVVVELWSRYRAMSGQVRSQSSSAACSLLEFEYVTAEVKKIRLRRQRKAKEELDLKLSSKGFQQALVYSASEVVKALVDEPCDCSRKQGMSTASELWDAVEAKYAVDVPANMLPCELDSNCKGYKSAQFITAGDLRAEHLLSLLPTAKEENVQIPFCRAFQGALQEMFPTDQGAVPWLHSVEWSDPQQCLVLLNEADHKLELWSSATTKARIGAILARN